MSSLITDLTVPPAVRATRLTAREAADAHGARRSAENPRIATVPYPMTIVFTVAGFIIAELVSLFFPQIAHVSFPQGQLWIFLLTGQEAYRALLVILAVVYAIAGIVDLHAADKREYYRSRAPFRFAMGVALALWDIAGTKLQTLPQPFFPGPAKVMEAFVTDGGYIVLNTLYSTRLFIAGFIVGVVLGVVTGVLIGWFDKAYYWVFPVLKITGVIPSVA